MDFGTESRFKLQAIIIVLVVAAVGAMAMFTDIFQGSSGDISQVVLVLAIAILLIIGLVILSVVSKIFEVIRRSNEQVANTEGMLEKILSALTQLSQSSRLSDFTKTIAFHDSEKQSFRDAVFDKLQQQDFEGAAELVDEISRSASHHKIAEQLKAEVIKYRNATVQERINQVIAHIEKLLDNFQWAQASALIERLIKGAPASEDAQKMRQKLVDKKGERKKSLLAAWDDAVKHEDTDQSIEILKELDLYLTPNEGLALQEAARDVFRNKLHSLGVQFALSVTAKQWQKAFETGQQIIHDFPNSRMAAEIRERMFILKQKAGK